MRSFLLSLLVVMVGSVAYAQKITGSQVLDIMYNRHAGKWYKNMGVVKDVDIIENGKTRPGGSWLMAMEFPGKFRMDIGDPATKTTILLSNKILYKWQDGKKTYENQDRSSLLFLTGGMYWYKRKEIPGKLVEYNIDPTKAYQTTYNGKAVYVLGAENAKDKLSQLWIEKDRLILLRIIEYDGMFNKIETRYEGHKKYGNYWIESKVSYLQGDKVLQVEKYKGDVLINMKLDPMLFDPQQLHNARHWYYNKVIK
jgi:hypothetical protein